MRGHYPWQNDQYLSSQRIYVEDIKESITASEEDEEWTSKQAFSFSVLHI